MASEFLAAMAFGIVTALNPWSDHERLSRQTVGPEVLVHLHETDVRAHFEAKSLHQLMARVFAVRFANDPQKRSD
jgi:hypothetical protein